MQDVNEITDRWKQEQEWTTNASDEVEHNQTYSFEMAFILAVWRQKVSIMWQIVFTTENGVIDPRRAFNITI